MKSFWEPLLINRAAVRRAPGPSPRRHAVLWTALFSFLIAVPAADAATPLPQPRPATSAPVPLPKPAYRPAWAIQSNLAKVYGPALELADKGAWSELDKQTRRPRDPALEVYLLWLRLEDAGVQASFGDIATFLEKRPDWPRRYNLVRRAELLMEPSTPDAARLAWFEKNPPISGLGYLKWLETLQKAGNPAAFTAAVKQTWSRARFTQSEQQRFLDTYRSVLTAEDHWRRLDRFLWLGASAPARAMMRLVTPEQARLAQARLNLREMSAGVDPAIGRVPKELVSDSGLIYERLRWRHRKGLKDEALELLWDAPEDPEFRSLWWNERARQVRYALDSGRLEDAYLLAAGHIQRKGMSFAEAQWHAGWIALRYRGKPAEAAGYFIELHEQVSTPISLARAAYWAGRSLEASGSDTSAKQWYARAAQHQTTFYGQLAAQKIPSTILRLPAEPTPNATVPASDNLRELVAIATSLAEIRQEKIARLFFREAARSAETRDEAVLVATSAKSLGYLDMGVYTARQAARSGHILTDAGYPLIEVPRHDVLETALILALIRQESGFDETARSRVGALGLMQLMPATARNVARDLKLPYGQNRLTMDPDYNMQLGTRYLRARLEEFGGDYVLALASYNAGPHRVRQWLKDRGDPRTGAVDMIDWIERIPFAETRNYVQRVLEAMHVYRLRLGSSEQTWSKALVAPAKGEECGGDGAMGSECAETLTARSK